MRYRVIIPTGHQQVDNLMPPEQKTFFQKYKKQVIILSAVILIFGLLVYFLFFYSKNTTLKNSNATLESNAGFSFKSLLGSLIGGSSDNSSPAATTTENTGYEDYYVEGLIKVWDKPVAGYGYYYKSYTYKYTNEDGISETATDTKTILQFVDSTTGFVYEKDLLAPTSSPIQVTNTPFPNTVRAYFINDNSGYKNRVILQSVAGDGITIKTSSADIPLYTSVPTNILNVKSLPDNTKYIAVSNDNKKVVYIINKSKSINGRDDTYTDWYYISTANDTYGKRVYTSEMADWKLSLLNNGEIYAFSGDTYTEKNYLYKLNIPKSGVSTLAQIYGDHNGMNFNIDKNSLIASIYTADGIKLYRHNSFSGNNFNDRDLQSLNFNTLANKCSQYIGSENGDTIICGVPKEIVRYESGLPDAWYQGMTTWVDNLYLVNSEYPSGQLLFDIAIDGKTSEKIDTKNLTINKFQSHLGFINKNDGSLWTLNIGNILFNNGD